MISQDAVCHELGGISCSAGEKTWKSFLNCITIVLKIDKDAVLHNVIVTATNELFYFVTTPHLPAQHIASVNNRRYDWTIHSVHFQDILRASHFQELSSAVPRDSILHLDWMLTPISTTLSRH